MRQQAHTLSLPESTFNILSDLIREHTGLQYDMSKRDLLADKLSPRALDLGFNSLLDYYYHLKYDPGAAEEWSRVQDALSVPETYFWRTAEQVHALVDVLLPSLAPAYATRPLTIWSAACASGEEPLTIAMALDMAGWFERLPIRIQASDASPAAIAKARTGIYGERSFRAMPPALRQKYFTAQGDRWRIDPEIHARVTWTTANLMCETEIAPLSRAPMIFCRNAFIYFSDQAIRQTVATFWRYMPDPAYLFLGSSESLLRITDTFELREIAGTFVYEKAMDRRGTYDARARA
jgi:chemotaxis protein methyltransferase CheR